MIYGSLCLFAPEGGAAIRPFPQWSSDQKTFKHTHHPQRGLIEISNTNWVTSSTSEVHLPQRSKTFWIYTESNDDKWTSDVNAYLVENLPHMEAQYEFTRQLYKFDKYQKTLKSLRGSKGFISTVVNNGDHSHLAILSQWMDVYVFGVYDTVNKSVRLVWTDDEWFVSDTRAQDPSRYVFYRYPVLQDRPLFLYPQALCSKWFGWTKNFQTPDGVLKAFNSLELFLYKEPELPTLNITPRHGSASA